MEEVFNAGGNFLKDLFLGVYEVASDYYKEKNKDAKYVKLPFNLNCSYYLYYF